MARRKRGISAAVRAREARAEYWADQIVDIADEASPDDVNKARLRIDARKWLMSKLLPKKYGDNLKHELTGKDGKPMRTQVDICFVSPKPQPDAPRPPGYQPRELTWW